MPGTAIFNQKLLRRFVALCALSQCLLLTGWAFPLQASHDSPTRPQKGEGRRMIDKLEDKWRDAILKNDAAMLEGLLSDDYIGINSTGTLQTKDQTLQSIRSGQWHITAFDVSDRKVRFYGRTALVTSTVLVSGNGPEGNATGTYRYTRVYARDPRGMWKVVNFEANRLGHPHHGGLPGSPGEMISPPPSASNPSPN